jgi:hypothetical protein
VLLQDVDKLTVIQIDVYFDFSHPIGSIAASDLMQQTTWNLCPNETAFSNSCYYATDNSVSCSTCAARRLCRVAS